MKKHLLSSEGTKALQSAIYAYDNEQLYREAISIAGDARAWIAANFELSTDQLEFIRGIAEDFMLLLGWNLAGTVLTRQPFTLDDLESLVANHRCKKVNIDLIATITSRYNCNSGSSTTSGSISIAFT